MSGGSCDTRFPSASMMTTFRAALVLLGFAPLRVPSSGVLTPRRLGRGRDRERRATRSGWARVRSRQQPCAQHARGGSYRSEWRAVRTRSESEVRIKVTNEKPRDYRGLVRPHFGGDSPAVPLGGRRRSGSLGCLTSCVNRPALNASPPSRRPETVTSRGRAPQRRRSPTGTGEGDGGGVEDTHSRIVFA